MVYTNIQLLYGIHLNTIQIKNMIYNINNSIDFDEDDYCEQISDFFANKQIATLLHAPCCSEHDTWYLGKVLHKYFRTNITCEQCEQYTCCDKCFGQTYNGYYNVINMMDDVSIVTDICDHCLHHLNGKYDCMDHCKYNKIKKIKNPNDELTEYLKNFIILNKLTPHYYLVLDDCIYCS